MPSIALLAPVVLPLIAAGVITAFGLSGFNLGPVAAGASAWAAVAALLVVWLAVRSTQELNLGPLGFGSSFQVRLDAVSFAFGLMVLLPAAVALTFQRRKWQEAAFGLLGVAAAAGTGDTAFRMAALTGATVQMVSHGLITGLLFFCVGVIYDHAHTREISVFGGVAKKMPLLATLFTFAGLASLGLPGLAGFVAEYMAFTGSFRIWSAATTIAVFTMILTAGYLLWMLKRVFYGPFNPKWNWLPDANLRELIPLLALAAVIVLVGVYPKPLIDVITPSLTHLIK